MKTIKELFEKVFVSGRSAESELRKTHPRVMPGGTTALEVLLSGTEKLEILEKKVAALVLELVAEHDLIWGEYEAEWGRPRESFEGDPDWKGGIYDFWDDGERSLVSDIIKAIFCNCGPAQLRTLIYIVKLFGNGNEQAQARAKRVSAFARFELDNGGQMHVDMVVRPRQPDDHDDTNDYDE